MRRKRFESKEAFVAHAEQNGVTCLVESERPLIGELAKAHTVIAPRGASRQLLITPLPTYEMGCGEKEPWLHDVV